MAYSKADKFSPAEYHFSIMCKALSHPARVKLINNIATNKVATYQQAAKGIPLTRPAIFQHLKVLREMDVIICVEKHPKVEYKLNYEIPNTSIGLITMAMNFDMKYDHKFKKEIKRVERRLRREVKD